MSHNTTTLNGLDPASITTDNIPPTASKGFTPLVDVYCGASVDVDALSDVSTGVDGQYLGYTSASSTWEGKTVSVTASQGSMDWRYPSMLNWNAGSNTAVAGERWHLGRKPGGGIIVTELPSPGADPVQSYNYSGGASYNTLWPTAWKVAAGHYLLIIQCRPRYSGSFSATLQIKNYTSGIYWGPRVFFDDLQGSDSGPTELVGCGSASLNDQIGVEIVDGKAMMADEAWA